MSYSNELTLSVWQSNNRQKEGKCEEDAQIQKSNFLIVEDSFRIKISITPIGKMIYGPVDRYEEMFHEFASICKGEIENPYTLEHEQLTHDILLAACGEFGKENTL